MSKSPLTVNDLGTSQLVETSRRVEINDIVRKAMSDLKRQLISLEVSLNGSGVGLTTSITGGGGVRFWFLCPSCGKRVGTLFQKPNSNAVSCRKCNGLYYRKERYSKMIELQV
jgi:hypothetical protein